jgi:copper chaperone
MTECCSGSVRSDVTLNVSGMTCEHCKKSVEAAVEALPGIESAKAIIQDGRVNVSFEPAKVSLDDILEAIREAGFEVEE